ncbi:Molybdenum cofactor sulfurase, C-terminal [Artemisia annua]|uniref:Molybdenum cofactor sulfurase, C-terminal n=1 Tax=Artemisia annua TaxID=35608 RepID=A0A2U1Q8E3_ARTAN|nr:Molybdenum cofactor sulfurase, C-terminal [Artemisia annua]
MDDGMVLKEEDDEDVLVDDDLEGALGGGGEFGLPWEGGVVTSSSLDHFNFIKLHHTLGLSSHHSLIRAIIVDVVINGGSGNKNGGDVRLIQGFQDGREKRAMRTTKVWVKVPEIVVKTSEKCPIRLHVQIVFKIELLLASLDLFLTVVRAPGMMELKVSLSKLSVLSDGVLLWEWSASAFDEGDEAVYFYVNTVTASFQIVAEFLVLLHSSGADRELEIIEHLQKDAVKAVVHFLE